MLPGAGAASRPFRSSLLDVFPETPTRTLAGENGAIPYLLMSMTGPDSGHGPSGGNSVHPTSAAYLASMATDTTGMLCASGRKSSLNTGGARRPVPPETDLAGIHGLPLTGQPTSIAIPYCSLRDIALFVRRASNIPALRVMRWSTWHKSTSSER